MIESGGESSPLSHPISLHFPAMTFQFDVDNGYKLVWIDDIPCVNITAMTDEELASLLEVTVDQLLGV